MGFPAVAAANVPAKRHLIPRTRDLTRLCVSRIRCFSWSRSTWMTLHCANPGLSPDSPEHSAYSLRVELREQFEEPLHVPHAVRCRGRGDSGAARCASRLGILRL